MPTRTSAAGLSWDTVKWAFTSIGSVTPDVPDWHPLAWISHATDAQMFGSDDPAGPHDVNLLLHVLNVVLLFWVLQRATGSTGRSAMVAALFALHPINVESVAWIAERKNLLSMTFFLLALAAYGWYARKPRVGRYIVVAVFFALGLMAKPQVITLPFVLLLWDYWPLRRMLPASHGAPAELPSGAAYPAKSFSSLVVEKLPLFALAAVSAIITMKSQLAGGQHRQRQANVLVDSPGQRHRFLRSLSGKGVLAFASGALLSSSRDVAPGMAGACGAGRAAGDYRAGDCAYAAADIRW